MHPNRVTIQSDAWGPIECERFTETNSRTAQPVDRWVATCDSEPFASERGSTAQEAADNLVEALEGE